MKASDHVYPLHRWGAFAQLTADEQSFIAELASNETTRRAGATIRSEEDAVTGIYLLIEGWVTSSITLRSGARLIQKVHLPGDVLGATSMVLSKAADTLTAVTEVTFAFVSLERLRSIFSERPRLAALITFAAQAERLAVVDALVVKGRANAKEQLAYLIFDLHTRLTFLGAVKDDRFDLPLTQELIADLSGLTAVHVNRTLGALRADGLIEQKGRELHILDVDALRRLSPMSPRQLKYEATWLPSPL